MTTRMSHLEINLEFQPNLQRILVPIVNMETTTVDEALEIFSEQEGMVRTSIKRAIPYRPVFSDLRSGQFVPETAPSHMPLSDIFSREGGLFVVDLEDESLKLLTPSHLKPKKNKNKKKKKKKAVTRNEDSDDESAAMNPGLIDGSATSALEDAVSTTDFDDMAMSSDVRGTAQLDEIKLMFIEMQRKMERDMAEKMKETAEETGRLEKEMKEMTNRLEKEMEKTSKLEKEMEKERTKQMEKTEEMEEKMSRLEKEIEDERKKRSVLEIDVDDLKNCTNDIADWIVAGCIPKNGGEPLRRIQIRNLLDRVQAKLAWLIGLSEDRYTRTGSAVWRESLEGSTHSERLASARTLLQAALQNHGDVIEKVALTSFMLSNEAMQLAVEAKSQFRVRGDQVAHHNLTKPQFISILEEHQKMGGRRGDGLNAFVQFLFP